MSIAERVYLSIAAFSFAVFVAAATALALI
jgi:hypothetical protein